MNIMAFLRLTDEEYEETQSCHIDLRKEARFLLKYGTSSEGYCNSEKFMIQVAQAVTIAEAKYPRSSHNIVFSFDQNRSCTAYAKESLNINGLIHQMVDQKG